MVCFCYNMCYRYVQNFIGKQFGCKDCHLTGRIIKAHLHRRFLSRLSCNMFETWCNFSTRKVVTRCRDKTGLYKRALILRSVDWQSLEPNCFPIISRLSPCVTTLRWRFACSVTNYVLCILKCWKDVSVAYIDTRNELFTKIKC